MKFLAVAGLVLFAASAPHLAAQIPQTKPYSAANAAAKEWGNSPSTQEWFVIGFLLEPAEESHFTSLSTTRLVHTAERRYRTWIKTSTSRRIN